MKKGSVTMAMEQRFWAKVDRNGPVPKLYPELGNCWVWTAGTRWGYGVFKLNGRNHVASRVAWQIQHGEIPDGIIVLHKCDNPPCVRGSHLFLGTRGDNAADRDAKGRQARQRGEAHGRAKLTEADVVEIRTRHAAGGVTQRELAEEFGVDRTNIGLIVNRKNWAHV